MIEVTGRQDGLEVIWAEDQPAPGATPVTPGRAEYLFPWKWLRDHGEDPRSLDPDSLQRKVDTFALPDDLHARYLTPDEHGVLVDWPDGSQSNHTWQFLLNQGADRRPPLQLVGEVAVPQGADRRLWSTPPEHLRAGVHERVMADEQIFAQWLWSIHQYGWGLLEGVPTGRDAVTELAERIGYVRQTVFGGVWELSSDVTEHQDSAYDTTTLEPHTDGTYSHDAPGLQLFCCQERDGTGGQSVIVDGFAAVAELSTRHAQVLASVDVPGRYVEPGVHLVAERPPLRVDPWGVLQQVSFNNYDRAPFLLEADAQHEFYEAYAALHGLVNNQSRWLTLDWAPGRMLIIDNWRVMHGRTAYTGARRFLGAYLNHEDFESRLRIFSQMRAEL